MCTPNVGVRFARAMNYKFHFPSPVFRLPALFAHFPSAGTAHLALCIANLLDITPGASNEVRDKVSYLRGGFAEHSALFSFYHPGNCLLPRKASGRRLNHIFSLSGVRWEFLS